ncbi:MAG: septal ring lytic transglycosylase RlpA family protein [Candidatus Dactylopiibacterium sp.]|nr:septal ring lytic transglycosylase RlpA family protein [Candidatus Dactylopiibacterium sp.]
MKPLPAACLFPSRSASRALWRAGLGALLPLLFAACASTPSAPPGGSPAARPAGAATPPPAAVPTPRGGGYYKDDGPGDVTPANLDLVPDAVPRIEPLRPANARPYVALGQTFVPMTSLQAFTQEGVGSWYGRKFHGALTSSGEPYDMYGMTAAHPTLPLPSYARVTNLENGRQVVVRVNDRGPFLRSRVIDLSYTAAYKLGYVGKGHARVRVESITHDEIESGMLARATAPVVQPPPAIRPDVPPVVSPVPVALPAPGLPAAAPATPAPAPAPAPAAQPAAQPLASGGVFLQLGAFASSANAESFRDYVTTELAWLRHGVNALLIGDKYRLRVGPFADAAEARSVAERIAAAIGTRPFVVQ